MGENYVLGNRDDKNEFKPFKLDARMFEEKKVLQIACGTQHVCALIQDGDDQEIHQVDHAAFVLIESQFPVKPPKKENEEEENEEDIIELPEFTKTLSKKHSMISSKEKTNTTNGTGEKLAEMKVSEATTAVQEQQK